MNRWEALVVSRLCRVMGGPRWLSCGSHGGKAQGIELSGLSQKNMTDFFVGVSSSRAALISPLGYHDAIPLSTHSECTVTLHNRRLTYELYNATRARGYPFG